MTYDPETWFKAIAHSLPKSISSTSVVILSRLGQWKRNNFLPWLLIYKNVQGHAHLLPSGTLWMKFDPDFVEKGISGSENIFYTSDI